MTIPDVPVELVTWRISIYAPAPAVSLAPSAPSGGAPVAKGERPVRFSRKGEPVVTPVYDRSALGAGDRLVGPAIVEERETTCVLPPGWVGELVEDGSLVATPGGPR